MADSTPLAILSRIESPIESERSTSPSVRTVRALDLPNFSGESDVVFLPAGRRQVHFDDGVTAQQPFWRLLLAERFDASGKRSKFTLAVSTLAGAEGTMEASLHRREPVPSAIRSV